MKNLFLILIIIGTCYWSHSFAQKLRAPTFAALSLDDIDSLKKELAVAKNDSDKVLISNALCWANKNDFPDSSIAYGLKALTLSRKMNYSFGEVEALVSISFVQRSFGNPIATLELLFKSLKIAEKNKLDDMKAWCNERIGVSYLDLKNHKKALDYLVPAAEYFASNQDSIMLAIMHLQLSYIYLDMNQIDLGYQYAKLAFEELENFNAPISLGQRYAALIKAYEKKGDMKAAFNLQQKLLQSKNLDLISKTRSRYIAADLYKKLNKVDSATYYAEQSLSDAQKGSFYNDIINAATFLSDIYKKKNPIKTIEYNDIVIAAKDSLLNKYSSTGTDMLFNFNEQERQYEIETAQKEYKNQIRQYLLLAGLSVFLLIAFILYRNNRQKQIANAILEKTLTDLKATQAQLIQSEKMASLGELTAGIAHEIQNPLNFVNNYSEVNVELLEELREELKNGNPAELKQIVNDLTENEAKIHHHGQRADSIVRSMMQHSRTNSGTREPTNLNALADEYLRLAYQGMRSKDDAFEADYVTDFDEKLPMLEIAPSDMGRVFLNIINNAFQACAERSRITVVEKRKVGLENYHPTVKVSTRMLENSVEIRISDNGNGIPKHIQDKIFQPFFTTKPTGQGTGLGLSLAYDIVKAQGGELTMESEPGKGTELMIRLNV